MELKTISWLPWIMVLVLSFAFSGISCPWERKTVRVLVLLDDYDQHLSKEFYSFTSEESLNSLYFEPGACVPKLKFNFLIFNKSSSEIDPIEETYRRFSQYSFCFVILATRHRHSWYAMEYANRKHIPVINVIDKV